MFRIGFGFDVHQLVEGISFYLGGIEIPHKKGSLGHSDGDALIHSICDALLGAANLRDIGFHFPDSSNEFKDIDSKILLKNVISMLAKHGFSVVNIDSTICLQMPKISEYIPQMQNSLANTMSVDVQAVSIKATTTEKMGFIGREEGIAVYAVALVQQKE